jgi:hypothetical protein
MAALIIEIRVGNCAAICIPHGTNEAIVPSQKNERTDDSPRTGILLRRVAFGVLRYLVKSVTGICRR